MDNLTGGSGQFAMVANNYINDTTTSLITPQFDLSVASALVLRFNSYFIADTFESIHVDVSTDGGAGWGNVWTHQGFNPFPTQYVMGLSGPANGALEVSLNAALSWTAGADTDSHDVYFGTVNPPDAGPPASAGQAGTTYDPGLLAEDTIYYWQVNETNAEGTILGPVWSFTTVAPRHRQPRCTFPACQGMPFPAARADGMRWWKSVLQTMVTHQKPASRLTAAGAMVPRAQGHASPGAGHQQQAELQRNDDEFLVDGVLEQEGNAHKGHDDPDLHRHIAGQEEVLYPLQGLFDGAGFRRFVGRGNVGGAWWGLS